MTQSCSTHASGTDDTEQLYKLHETSTKIPEVKGAAIRELNGDGCCLLVACLTSQQHASVSQGRICSDNFTCCHTETEVADQTFHLTQSQYTDTGPTSPSTDPITRGALQGSHRSANFHLIYLYDSTPEKSRRKRDLSQGSSALKADTLTTRPTRRCSMVEFQVHRRRLLLEREPCTPSRSKGGRKLHTAMFETQAQNTLFAQATGAAQLQRAQ